jgi:hypothetical protein
MSLRGVCATLLILCYGAACYWSIWNQGRALLAFGLVSLLAALFIGAGILAKIAVGMIITAVLGLVSVVIPVLAPVIGIIILLVMVVRLVSSMQAFAKRAPYLLSAGVAYAFLWYVPHLFRPDAGPTPGQPGHALITVGIAAAGVLLLLIIAGIGALFDASPTTCLFFTLAYGWYIIMFVVALFFAYDNIEGFDGDA